MNIVSIIIPVYQVSDYVERCLKSVIKQTFTDLECILVDDATRDDSIIKCKQLIDDYKGPICFRILHHEQNKGLSAARNTGLNVATGEYIYFLDSDDELTTNCIEKLILIAQKNPEMEMVIGRTWVIRSMKSTSIPLENKTHSKIQHVQSNERVFSYYNNRLLSDAAWNKLIKRSFIKNHSLYFKESIIHEDLLWMFYVVKCLSKVSVINEVTYYYYIRPGSITTKSDVYTEGNCYRIVYNEILHHLTINREKNELNRFVDGFCLRYLVYKEIIPSYKELFDLYRQFARKHCSRYASIVLNSVEIINWFGNPIGLMEKLNVFRWKLKRIKMREFKEI